MDRSRISYWVSFILSIVVAVVVSDRLAAAMVALTGATGVVRFLLNFLVFALAFFGAITLLGRLFRINFFCCVR